MATLDKKICTLQQLLLLIIVLKRGTWMERRFRCISSFDLHSTWRGRDQRVDVPQGTQYNNGGMWLVIVRIRTLACNPENRLGQIYGIFLRFSESFFWTRRMEWRWMRVGGQKTGNPLGEERPSDIFGSCFTRVAASIAVNAIHSAGTWTYLLHQWLTLVMV